MICNRKPRVGEFAAVTERVQTVYRQIDRVTEATAFCGPRAIAKRERSRYASGWRWERVSPEFVAAEAAYYGAWMAWISAEPSTAWRQSGTCLFRVSIDLNVGLDAQLADIGQRAADALAWWRSKPTPPSEADYPPAPDEESKP